jgi:hypothetical protein
MMRVCLARTMTVDVETAADDGSFDGGEGLSSRGA